VSAKTSGLAQSVQARLLAHAKRIGVDPNLVLIRFATERYLYRLSRSRHADRFVIVLVRKSRQQCGRYAGNPYGD